jgi:hypothetical protein
MTPPLACVALHTYVRGRALQSMVRGFSAMAYTRVRTCSPIFARMWSRARTLSDVIAK